MDDDDRLAFELAARARRRARRRGAARKPAPDGMGTQPAPASAAQHEGEAAERRAERLLAAAGLTLVARNLRCRSGELDLVMRDGAVLVFVEVRARRDPRFGGALASVGPAKQRRLAASARTFLRTMWRGPVPPCRFDVVAYDGADCRWVRAAFEPGGD